MEFARVFVNLIQLFNGMLHMGKKKKKANQKPVTEYKVCNTEKAYNYIL